MRPPVPRGPGRAAAAHARSRPAANAAAVRKGTCRCRSAATLPSMPTIIRPWRHPAEDEDPRRVRSPRRSRDQAGDQGSDRQGRRRSAPATAPRPSEQQPLHVLHQAVARRAARRGTRRGTPRCGRQTGGRADAGHRHGEGILAEASTPGAPPRSAGRGCRPASASGSPASPAGRSGSGRGSAGHDQPVRIGTRPRSIATPPA